MPYIYQPDYSVGTTSADIAAGREYDPYPQYVLPSELAGLVVSGASDAAVASQINSGSLTQGAISASIASRVTGLRPLPLIRSVVFMRSSDNVSYPSRILNYEPFRRRVIVQNVGTTTVLLTHKNTDNSDFNAPSAGLFTGPTTGVTLLPGQEVVTTNPLTMFAKANVNLELGSLIIYSEAASY